ncbi:hypothetical protein RIF29_39419 [Crotalaria pallida]|uniref:Uncharacterized protein n=1 Tax=Crotalaria pallida TaxID=3830 RepID=A0AAN9E1S2_CROPI
MSSGGSPRGTKRPGEEIAHDDRSSRRTRQSTYQLHIGTQPPQPVPPPAPPPGRGTRRSGKEIAHDDRPATRTRQSTYQLRIATQPSQPVPPPAPQAPIPHSCPPPPSHPTPPPQPIPRSRSCPPPPPQSRSCPPPPPRSTSRPQPLFPIPRVLTQPQEDTHSPHGGTSSSSVPGPTSASPSHSGVQGDLSSASDSNCSTNVMCWPKPPGKEIMVKAGGFWPGKRAADAITLTLKQGWHYKEPGYGKLKKEQKDELFERFRENASWQPFLEPEIRKLFNSSMSSRIRNTFAEARKKNVCPNWLQVDIWECLCAHWQTDEYKRIQEVGKANRASEKGGSLHTGGKKTIIDHARDMAEALNRTVYLDEVFEQTHIKKSGGWVDDRSRMTHIILSMSAKECWNSNNTLINYVLYPVNSCFTMVMMITFSIVLLQYSYTSI